VRIIPVLDVRGGVVVRAVAGQRAAYQPLVSVLTARTDPLGVAEDLWRALGMAELYVADLDAIEEGGASGRVDPGVAAVAAWAERVGVRVLLDAGVGTVEAARALARARRATVVVGTETLGRLSDLARIVALLGAGQVVGSLDPRGDVLLSPTAELAGCTPEQAVGLLASQGIQEVLVLDLARVGARSGPLSSLGRIAHRWPGLAVLAGGGVRGGADLLALAESGVAGALVATALHDGVISGEEWWGYARGEGEQPGAP